MSVVTSVALMGCGSNDSLATPTTVGQAEALVSARDVAFTRTKVCEDYELAIYLLALVQPPHAGTEDTTDTATLTADLASCPGTYSGVVAALAQRIAARHDYHTHIGGAGMDAMDHKRFFPTVTSCDTPALCGGTIGSTLSPMLGGDDQHLYAYAAERDGGVLLLGIEEINGLAPDAAIGSARATEILGLSTLGGPKGGEMLVLLGRTPFDGRDRAPVTLRARDLRTEATVAITADFSVSASYTPPANQPSSNLNVKSYPAGSYGCMDTASGSNKDYGACLTDQGRLVVWIYTFGTTLVDPGIVPLITSYLAAHLDAAAKPVFLDVRGNSGGYTDMMLDFLCTFGDDLVVQAISDGQLVTSYYPAQFTLSSGRVVQFGTEIGLDPGVMGPSGDATAVDDPTWTVTSAAPDANRRTFTSSWWDVGSGVASSANICALMRDLRFTDIQWVIGTMGPEFSATEDMLYRLSASPSRFLQLGSLTKGGCGFPDLVTLPNTGLLLEIATTRERNGNGTWIIEDEGVAPAVTSTQDLSTDFERRMIDLSQGVDVSGSSYSDILFRTAEALTLPDGAASDAEIGDAGASTGEASADVD